MQIKRSVIAGYLALLLPPLGALAFHRYVSAHAVEHTRMGNLPDHFSFWRWFGPLACGLLLLTITFLVASFRDGRFARASFLLGLAAAQLVFLTIYGIDTMICFSHILKD